nr:viridiflorene synthase-like [Coffea arabica]XP_027102276.1 viridiflorene synthase-like [Coffea arabica]
MASAETAGPLNNQHEIVRQLADFPENIWTDRIASFTLDKQGYEMYAKEIEMLKEEVMSMLLETEKPMMEKFDVIDKIERLGISHYFEDKIEHQLQELFDTYPNFQEHPECDLLTAALQFRLFRQHGFNISCGILDQFIDDNGKFKESLCEDIRGLLSLYEAAHIRANGDKILEEALAFTTTHLTLGVPHLGSTLAKQVKHALEQPLHKGIPRYEAYCYISMYEKDESNNKLLLRLAKLDYHLLQMLYKQELSEIIRWGKDLDIVTKVPYARDRIVECYFWAVGTYYEPQYSLARMTFAKAIVFAGMIDDTYDAYGTLDELKIFTESIERWDGNGIDQLSDYLKAAYTMLLNFNKELEEDLAKKGRTFVFDKYIEEWKQYMRTSFTQSKWFLTNKLPSFADYLSSGMITSTYYLLPSAAFLGVDGASEDVIKWMSTNPRLFVALTTHARLTNDVGSHKFEKERGSGTAIECYMKDYNVSEEEAMKKFEEMCEDTWKIMNEERSRLTTIPREILKVILNLARVCEVVYKHRGDGFTDQRRIEAHIKAMITDSISVCG